MFYRPATGFLLRCTRRCTTASALWRSSHPPEAVCAKNVMTAKARVVSVSVNVCEYKNREPESIRVCAAQCNLRGGRQCVRRGSAQRRCIMLTDQDREFLRRCIELAATALE